MGNKAANKQIAAGQADKDEAKLALDTFQYGQQKGDVANPYANVTNPFANLKNPFSGLQVDTAGAEFQREANQESFASILDAQLQGGGGAGQNATALARAAGQANKGIAAGLSQQQAQNQKLTAQGALQTETLRGQGQQRAEQLQGAGAQYVQQVSEARDTGKLEGLGAQYAGAQQTINAGYKAKADVTSAWIKGITGLAGTVLTAGAGGGAGGGFGFGGNG